jgi:predicted MFS family arabinose efflux permease
MTMNLGFALGGLVAGLIARTAHPSSFTVLFLMNAATFLVFAAVLQLVPAPRPERGERPGRYVDVFRHRLFIAYVLLNVTFIGAGIAIGGELLAPFAKNTAGVDERAIGLLAFTTALVIALAQLPVVKLVEGKRRMRGLALMGAMWAAAFVGVLGAGAWFSGNRAAELMGVALVVFALGECLHGAIYAPLVADLAAPRLIGRYMALSSFSWQLGFLLGPAAGGFVLQHAPLTLWPAAAGICLAASAYALALERHLPEGVRVTPAEVDPRAGVVGTMPKMAAATEDPLSTGAEPAPHPANTAATGGRRTAPTRGTRR